MVLVFWSINKLITCKKKNSDCLFGCQKCSKCRIYSFSHAKWKFALVKSNFSYQCDQWKLDWLQILCFFRSFLFSLHSNPIIIIIFISMGLCVCVRAKRQCPQFVIDAWWWTEFFFVLFILHPKTDFVWMEAIIWIIDAVAITYT